MFDKTIAEYFISIRALEIDAFITYYFAAYFFVILLQRALMFKVDVGEVRFSPEILSGLILVQLFKYLSENLVVLETISAPFARQICFAIIFVIGIFFVRLLLLSERGLFRLFFYAHAHKVAKGQLRQLRGKKFGRGNAKYRDVDHAGVWNHSKENSVNSRKFTALFAIDAYISAHLFLVINNLDPIVGPIFLVASLVFITPRYSFLVKQASSTSKLILTTDI